MTKKGFTLLELAIVLIIIGVLSAGAAKVIFGAFAGTKTTTTKNSIAAAIKDIASYTVRARKLPVPLSTPVTQKIDSFGTDFQYSNPSADSLLNGAVSICDINDTKTKLLVCADSACSSPEIDEENIAFIVFSLGENKTAQYTSETNDGVTTFTYYKEGVTVGGVQSDDIVGWMNLGTLKAMAGCEGSLAIEQNKLPDAVAFNTYSFKLTPKGGVGDYSWCVASDNSVPVQSSLRFGTAAASGGNAIAATASCETTSTFISSTNNIYIHSNNSAIAVNDNNDGSAIVKVVLKDSNGVKVSKNFNLKIVRPFEVAMDAPIGGTDPEEPEDPEGVIGGFSSFESSFGDTSSTNKSDASAIISSNELQIVQNNSNSTTSVFIDCSSNPSSSNACPKFENRGKLSIYFMYNYENNPLNQWGKPHKLEVFGYVFAVIKSYKPGTDPTNASSTTLTSRGDAGPGMGYGDNGWIDGINGGNSFGVEFDLEQSSANFYRDPDDDHLAIVSRVDTKTVWWANGHDVPAYDVITEGSVSYRVYNSEQVYNSSAHNAHSSTIGNSNQYFSHNDDYKNDSGVVQVASKQTGKGLYYDSTSAVIPNNYGVANPVKYGTRIEAVSGCNYKCTVCNAQTGRNNFISVNVWRTSETNMNSSATLKTNMQNVGESYTYNKTKNGTAYPLGSPLMSDCIPDDMTSNKTLDSIRFGFTSGKWSSSYAGLIKFTITDFKGSVTQYPAP